MRPIPRLHSGQVVGERFRVEKPAGESEQPGNSYIAIDQSTKTRCVVKVLAQGRLDETNAVRGVFASLRAVGSLALPRLRSIWTEQVDGQPCILVSQDHVDGTPLDIFVSRQGPLTFEQAAWLATNLLKVLETLAEAKLIHGDIQPGNVLVDEELQAVFLVDFGCLKAAARDMDMEDIGGPSGWTSAVTRAYAAPEARLGKPALQSDLYGVGGVLFHALTGRKPGEVRRSLSGGVEPVLLDYDVPGPLAWFVGRLLHFTSGDRFESPADALRSWRLRELEDELANEAESDPEELTNLHLEPLPDLRRRWIRVGLLVAMATAIPLFGGTLLALLSALGNADGMSLYTRIILGLCSAGLAIWHLVFHLPELVQLGTRSVAVTAQEFRYSTGADWQQVPWRKIHRIEEFGPLLLIRGIWRTRRKGKDRERILILAPIYDLSLGDLARFMDTQIWRARAEITDVRRIAEKPPAGQILPSFVTVGLLGLVLLAILLVEQIIAGWDIYEMARPGAAQDERPPPGVAALLAAGGAAGDAAVSGAQGPGGEAPPDAAPAEPLPSLVELMSKQMGDMQDLSPQEVESLEAATQQALQAFDEIMAAQGMSGVADSESALTCPVGFTVKALASAESMFPACRDDFSTMVVVTGQDQRPPFLVDWTEVTVGDYSRCVGDGICQAAETGDGCNQPVEGMELHPVNCVDRRQAARYCEWAGRRLCRAEEWERAAGTDRPYPWGSKAPDCSRAVMFGFDRAGPAGPGCGQGGTAPVGSRMQGASPFGALDMAGNVAEWVTDARGTVRGGSLQNRDPRDLTNTAVELMLPMERDPAVGFRCCLEF